jgi:glycine cleavage system H protein
VKAASDIYAPVKGTVVEVNKALEADPGLDKSRTIRSGLDFRSQDRQADDLKQLKDAAAYRAVVGG